MNFPTSQFSKAVITIMMTAVSIARCQNAPDDSQISRVLSNQQSIIVQGEISDFSVELENPKAWQIMKSSPGHLIPGGFDLVVRGPNNGINFEVNKIQVYASSDQLMEAGKQSRLKADPNVQFLSTNTVIIDGLEWEKLVQNFHKYDGSPNDKVTTYSYSGCFGTYQILCWTAATDPDSDMLLMDKIVRTWKRGPGMLAEEKMINEASNKSPLPLTRIPGGLFDYSVEVENPAAWQITRATPQQPAAGGWDLSMHGNHTQITFNVNGSKIYKSSDEAMEALKQDRLKEDPNVRFLSTNSVTIDGIDWKELEILFHHPEAPQPLRMTIYVHSGKDGTHNIIYWSPMNEPYSEMIELDKIARSWKRGAVMLAEDRKIMESADKTPFEVDNSSEYPTTRISGTDYNYSLEIPALKSNQILRGKGGDLAIGIPELSGFTLAVLASGIYQGDVTNILDKIEKSYLINHPDAVFSTSESITIDGEKWMRVAIRFPSRKMFIRACVYSGSKGMFVLTGGVEGNPVDEVKYTPILDKVEESFKFGGLKIK